MKIRSILHINANLFYFYYKKKKKAKVCPAVSLKLNQTRMRENF